MSGAKGGFSGDFAGNGGDFLIGDRPDHFGKAGHLVINE